MSGNWNFVKKYFYYFQIRVEVPVTLFAGGPEHTFSAVLTATTKNGSPDTIVPHSNVSDGTFL